MFHLLDDDPSHRVLFIGRHAEIQFVVYLQDHFRLQPQLSETAVDACHGHFDDVRRAALYGRVDGVAFGIASYGGVARTDVRQETLAAEDGFHIPLPAARLDAGVHVFLHAGVGLEISVDKLLGFLAVHVHSLGQSECRYAVDDSEVGGLGLAAHVWSDGVQVCLIDFGGCRGVYVMSASESLDHVRIAAEVSHDAQFDLRIVGREELASVIGDEGFADLLAVLVTDGDVLQVGVAGAEPSRGRHRLVERRVDASCVRIDELGECLDVGAEQFLQAPVFQYFFYDRMSAPQAFERFLVGDILSRLGFPGLVCDLQPVEQDFSHLFGRGDVEVCSGQCVDLLLDVFQTLAEVRGRLFQCFRVDAHPVSFHVDEHGHQGHFDVAEQGFGSLLLQLLFERPLQAEGDVGILTGVAEDLFGRKVTHGLLPFAARADQLVDVDGLVMQVDFGQVVHVVSQFRLQDIMGQHGVEQRAAHFGSIVHQDNHVILDVLSHLHRLLVFIDGAKLFHQAACLLAVGRRGDVVGVFFGIAETHSYQLGLHRFGAGGLRVY